MKELKGLERRMRISEGVHLALMAICFSITIALLFKEDDQMYRLLWGLGVVIPVSLIRVICLYVNKKPLRILLTAVVFAATMFVTRNNYHFVYYLLTCIPITISGLFLPRPKGRLIFSIPNVASLVAVFVPYGMGQAAHVPLLSRLAVALSALLTLNFFLYLNQNRLLTDIRMSIHTEVSVSGLIRQNTKVVAIFFAAGILVLAAIPFLLKAAPQTTEQLEEIEITETAEPELLTPDPKDYMNVPEGEEINLDFIPMAMGFLMMLGPILVLVGLGFLIYYLLSRIEGKKKHPLPEIRETMTVEKLAPEALTREKEHVTGYEKKIRRRYEKLIKSRTAKDARLSPLTPTELERAAEVAGDGAETIHTVYRETRYSGEPATRESYAAFKEALRSLPKPSRAEEKK